MSKALLIIAFLLSGISTLAQFVLGRQSISCFSIRACDELCINSTAGQIDFGTLTNDQTIFTSGFEQTEGASNLYATVEFKQDDCSGKIWAVVTRTFGCEDSDSIRVFWDNALSGFSTQLSGSLHALRIETSNGCTFEKTYDFQQISIPVIPCGLELFNYVSPNGDGSNDRWIIGKIDAPDFAENEVVILNRWGSEVWRGKNYDNETVCWTGLAENGNPLPDGTYFFRITTVSGEFTGYIELMR
jgi:gliding motility-associated-like protein